MTLNFRKNWLYFANFLLSSFYFVMPLYAGGQYEINNPDEGINIFQGSLLTLLLLYIGTKKRFACVVYGLLFASLAYVTFLLVPTLHFPFWFVVTYGVGFLLSFVLRWKVEPLQLTFFLYLLVSLAHATLFNPHFSRMYFWEYAISLENLRDTLIFLPFCFLAAILLFALRNRNTEPIAKENPKPVKPIKQTHQPIQERVQAKIQEKIQSKPVAQNKTRVTDSKQNQKDIF